MSDTVPLQIDVNTLKVMRQSGAQVALLDVREPWEFDLCAIEGSSSIPLATLPQRAGELPKDRQIVVICHHGGRSAQATAWLRHNGYGLPFVYNYDEGEVTDTVSLQDGYRQIKMFYDGKVMWTRYVPKDSVEWFGYGTYITTDTTLTEVLEYMSASMRRIANANMEWNMKLEMGKDRYSQIFTDSEGNPISSENYKRID